MRLIVTNISTLVCDRHGRERLCGEEMKRLDTIGNAYLLVVDNEEDLAGLPESVVEGAAQEAKRNNAEASGWAVEYIQRALQAGILAGVDDGKGGLTIASPQGNSTRQEMATMGVAILEAVKKELAG